MRTTWIKAKYERQSKMVRLKKRAEREWWRISVLLLMGGALLWCWLNVRTRISEPALPPIYREVIETNSHWIVSTKDLPLTLPAADVAEIVRLVRQEMQRKKWRDLKSFFCGSNYRMLTEEIRFAVQERIQGITVRADGSVEVTTIREHRPVVFHTGATYRLNKEPSGWRITSQGDWIE